MALVVVVGQGYVGVPLALRAVEVGHRVVGFDTDEARTARLAAGDSYIDDVSSAQLKAALATGRYTATLDEEACEGFDVRVEGFEDAAAARFGKRVDALNPPERAVAPVRPFVGNHHLTGGLAVDFGDQVEAARGIVEDGADSGAQRVYIQGATFGFEGHAGVAAHQKFGVFESGWADEDFGHRIDLWYRLEVPLTYGQICPRLVE